MRTWLELKCVHQVLPRRCLVAQLQLAQPCVVEHDRGLLVGARRCAIERLRRRCVVFLLHLHHPERGERFPKLARYRGDFYTIIIRKSKQINES